MEAKNILLALSIALFVGLMMSRLAKLAQLPAVTAYLVTGILIGPYVLGQLGISGLGFASMDEVAAMKIIADVSLGFIAFSIGNEFRMNDLKQIGKQATVIGIFQAVFTAILVDAALIGLSFAIPFQLPKPAAILLGAVATATAPAATLMVVRQYKAKGPVTKILLPIVALDDAVGLVVFAISFGVAKAMIAGNIDPISIIVEPLLEVVLSLLLGFLMGLLFTYCERFFHSRSKRLSMSVAFVLVTVAISMMKFDLFGGKLHISFSSLLACMMLGTVFCNICDFSEGLMDRLDRWTGPMFILFFVISGAELELSVFTNWAIVLIGVIYIITRSAGKYFGATISAKATKCDPNIVRYLGITLLPQAGVALGMALKAKELNSLVPAELLLNNPDLFHALSSTGTVVSNITLFAVLIYELVGPLFTKIALQKAGEIRPEDATSAREEDKNKDSTPTT